MLPARVLVATMLATTSSCTIAGVLVGARLATSNNDDVGAEEQGREDELGCPNYVVENDGIDDDDDASSGMPEGCPVELPRRDAFAWGTGGFLIGFAVDLSLVLLTLKLSPPL
jgi:hypothetical protein